MEIVVETLRCSSASPMISGTKRAVFRWKLWGWIIMELQCSYCFGPFSESI